MKAYFACSITGGRRDEPIYQKLVEALQAVGYQVPTAMLASSSVITEEAKLSPQEVYQRDTAWIEACDILVAEVSTPSHGVGYEIAYALHLGKPVLCLYRQGEKVSKMLLGNPVSNLTVRSYSSLAEAVKILHQLS